MKKILGFILMVVLAVAVYLPCRELAIMERGTSEGIGGEALVPVVVFLTYVVVADWFSEKEEEKEEERHLIHRKRSPFPSEGKALK